MAVLRQCVTICIVADLQYKALEAQIHVSAGGYHAAELQHGLNAAHNVLRVHCSHSAHHSHAALEHTLP